MLDERRTHAVDGFLEARSLRNFPVGTDLERQDLNWTYTRGPRGAQASVTPSTGPTTVYSVDHLGYTEASRTGTFEVVRTLDGDGQVVSETIDGDVYAYARDSHGRLTSHTRPGARVTETVYTPGTLSDVRTTLESDGGTSIRRVTLGTRDGLGRPPNPRRGRRDVDRPATHASFKGLRAQPTWGPRDRDQLRRRRSSHHLGPS